VSNVLIGIIGVILFIGLALAGALFLGPRFQESTNNSKASAMVQAVSQVAHAANLYELQEGRKVADGSPTALAPSYIKSIPTNPEWVSGLEIGSATRFRLVFAPMGSSEQMASVCKAIQKQTNGSETVPDIGGADELTGSVGCYMTGTSRTRVVWAKI
jgi:type II secretory pathway pseudopilin PulG